MHLITGSWDAPCAISWIVLADKISVFRRCGLCSWKGSIWSLLNNNAIRLQKINAYWHIRSFVPCIFASGKYIFLSLWICYVGNINLGIIVVLMSRHGLIFLYMHVLVFHIVFISAGYGTSKRRICALCDSYIIWGSYAILCFSIHDRGSAMERKKLKRKSRKYSQWFYVHILFLLFLLWISKLWSTYAYGAIEGFGSRMFNLMIYIYIS